MMEYLDESWLDRDEFILYGFGEKLAIPIFDDLNKSVKIKMIIDNNILKQGEYNGIPIVGFEAVKSELAGQKIIVALGNEWYPQIASQLKSIGMQENMDFCNVRTFFYDYFHAKLSCNVVFTIQSFLTSKCTLNCEKCCNFIPYFKEEYVYDITCLKKDYDLLFRFVDYVPLISLLGGEPFFYTQLSEIVEWLNEKYSKRYGCIIITTNGMLMPDEPLLKAFRKANVTVNVSDYTSIVPYEKRLKEVCGLFAKYQIRYSLCTFPTSWRDFGFPEQVPTYKSSSVREHMLTCHPACTQYQDGKLYFCSASWCAEKCGLFSLTANDYLSLNALTESAENRRKAAQYSMGKAFGLSGGVDYMSMCAVCNGSGSDNLLTVPPGLQKDRKRCAKMSNVREILYGEDKQ